MPLFNIFEVAGSALSAQTVRLNTTASNLANADTASGRPENVYQARHPVFASTLNGFRNDGSKGVGVRVLEITQSQAAPRKQYQPEHPLADDQGYIYLPNVNAVEEMANMISASRSYQNNVEIMNTSKQLLLRTLSLGQ